MRAIDADALINRIVFHTDWSTDEKEAFEDEVNAEPTIEPEQFNPCTVCQEFDCWGCKFRREANQ